MKATLPNGTQLEGTADELAHVLKINPRTYQAPAYVPTPIYVQPTPFVPTFEVTWGDHDLPTTTQISIDQPQPRAQLQARSATSGLR